MEPRPMVFTVDEAARKLKMSKRSVCAACQRGQLPGIKTDGLWRIGADALWKAVNTPWPEQRKEQ